MSGLGRSVADDVLVSARALLGADLRIAPCRGGRNSQVYRIESAVGTFAFKIYAQDDRNRAQREFAATSLFARVGMARVPRPLAIASSYRAAAYSWIDGEPVCDISLRDIYMLADFADELHALSKREIAASMPDATEACFDECSVVEQIQERFDRLTDIDCCPALSEFLHRDIAPVIDRERRRVYATKAKPGRRRRGTLSPSDFGFHNALRMTSGSIAFLDFEYFGWDDPVKLVADVCWHPGMALQPKLCEHFIARCVDVYRDDSSFEERFQRAFALYGLRWSLIVLNEFLPMFWERRVAAGMVVPAGSARPAQLDKARAILERVVERLEGDGQ